MHININEITFGLANNAFELKDVLPSLIGTVIGGLISAATSFLVAQKTHSNNFVILQEKEEMETKATIKAIISELKALREVFENEFLPKLENSKEYLGYSYPLGADYFTIFNSNTSKIGKIKNDELRECIVKLYMTAKVFLDCIRTNNEVLEDFVRQHDLICTQVNGQIDPNATKKQREDFDIALERLKRSKKENLLPACEKMQILFAQLDSILEK